MNKKAIDAFFELLRSGLWVKTTQLSQYGETNFEEILRIAEEPSTVGLVAAGLEHVIDVKPPQE